MKQEVLPHTSINSCELKNTQYKWGHTSVTVHCTFLSLGKNKVIQLYVLTDITFLLREYHGFGHEPDHSVNIMVHEFQHHLLLYYAV